MKVPGSSYAYIWKQQRFLKESFQGDAVTPFIGRYGYPTINVGIMSAFEDETNTYHFDDPELWAKNTFSAEQIIQKRMNMIHSRFQQHVKQKARYLDLTREVALAKRPFDVEVNLKNVPRYNLTLSKFTAPRGPTGSLKSARATENPKIAQKVDQVVNDDLKAVEQASILYKKKFPVHFLSRVLSVGTLGKESGKKLVPTRWSITAVDDMIGKELWQYVLDCPLQSDYEVYYGEFHGNYYVIIMIPGIWSYELMEIPASFTKEQNNFTTDSEYFMGRKKYADNCAGGYYAARLGVLEHMKKKKKQGQCLIIRWISADYQLALGVWVVREGVRKVLDTKPITFSDKELLLRYVHEKMKRSWSLDGQYFFDQSRLLHEYQQQTQLSQFI